MSSVNVKGVLVWVITLVLGALIWAFAIIGVFSLTGCQVGYNPPIYDPILEEIDRIEQEGKRWVRL